MNEKVCMSKEQNEDLNKFLDEVNELILLADKLHNSVLKYLDGEIGETELDESRIDYFTKRATFKKIRDRLERKWSLK